MPHLLLINSYFLPILLLQAFNVDDLPGEAFGGSRVVKRYSTYYQAYMDSEEAISNNAYMLVYERRAAQPAQFDAAPSAATPKPTGPMIVLDAKVRPLSLPTVLLFPSSSFPCVIFSSSQSIASFPL